MRRLLLVPFLATVFAVAGCGGSGTDSEDSPDLTGSQLRTALEYQFLYTDESRQGKRFASTLKEGSIVHCWSEGPTPICTAAVPNGFGEAESYSGPVDDWTFYKATFAPGQSEPEVDEIDASEAVEPEEARFALKIEKQEAREEAAKEKERAELSPEVVEMMDCLEGAEMTRVEGEELDETTGGGVLVGGYGFLEEVWVGVVNFDNLEAVGPAKRIFEKENLNPTRVPGLDSALILNEEFPEIDTIRNAKTCALEILDS